MTKGCGPRRKPPFNFDCNRPFIFIIHKSHKDADEDNDDEDGDEENKDILTIYFMAMVDLNESDNVA